MFNREKDHVPGARCSACGSPIGSRTVCSCGRPTPNMSFAERAAYELEQYRAHKARAESA
ncbi:MAG TPA: hypothetical protein VJ818_01130 [Actinomycetota bacterium]|nr:hypothetical protein [Actinomycetota bacterium]